MRRGANEASSAGSALLFGVQTNSAPAMAVISATDGETAMLDIIIVPEPARSRCSPSRLAKRIDLGFAAD